MKIDYLADKYFTPTVGPSNRLSKFDPRPSARLELTLLPEEKTSKSFKHSTPAAEEKMIISGSSTRGGKKSKETLSRKMSKLKVTSEEDLRKRTENREM